MKGKKKIQMSNLTIILPIHKYGETEKTYLEKAINSINFGVIETELLIIGPNNVLDSIKGEFNNLPAMFVENEECDYVNQINKAVANVKTPYFMVMEYDDTFTNKWFDYIVDYMEEYPYAFAYLPLVKVYDTKNTFLGFRNEVCWAKGFYEKPGYITKEGALNYLDFCFNGALIQTNEFLKLGGLKDYKIFSWYELCLNALENEKEIFTIPKVGYMHTFGVKDGMTDTYTQNTTEEDTEKYLESAQEKYVN